jgi:hypothetical protein
MASAKKRMKSRLAIGLALLLTATWWLGNSSTPTRSQPETTLDSSSPGLSFKRYRIREEPWSINVVRIDRSRTNFLLTTSLGGGTRQGLATLTQQLKRIPKELGKPVAAVNGDFYQTEGDRYAGDPRGLQIANGELISGPNERVSFWIDTNGLPRMEKVKPHFLVRWPNGDSTPYDLNEERGRSAALYSPIIGSSTKTSGGVEFILENASDSKWLPLAPGEKFPARIKEIRQGGNSRFAGDNMVLSFARLPAGSGATEAKVGDILWISTETTPSLLGVQTAIGGGPELVREGKAQPARVSKSNARHPRSALGWNNDQFFFVTVDGRQPRLSNGMTLPELADFLVKIGCIEAMNLDGGGSAEVWMEGKILNSPCYGHERSTANALVLLQKEMD